MPELFRFTIDTAGIDKIEAAMKAAGARAPDAIARALNWTGDRAKTRVARSLAKQTGLPYRTTEKALRLYARRASAANLVYRMPVKGGDISLKYFKPRETRGGVVARPFGKPRFYAGAFLTSGPPGRRAKSSKLHGQVFRNIAGGKWGGEIEKVKSGVFLPEEVVRGASAQAFELAVMLLPGRVEHEVAAILAGFAR